MLVERHSQLIERSKIISKLMMAGPYPVSIIALIWAANVRKKDNPECIPFLSEGRPLCFTPSLRPQYHRVVDKSQTHV